MLKPAPMQKVAVVGLRADRGRIVSVLYDLGAVQIESLSKPAAELLKAGTDVGGTRDVSEQLLRIRALKAALPPIRVHEKRSFSSYEEVLDAAKSIDPGQEVSQLKERVESLTTKLEDLKNRIDLVTNLQFVKQDLAIFDLESAVSFFVTISDSDSAVLENMKASGVIVTHSSGTDPTRLIVTVPRDRLEKFGSTIQKMEAKFQRIPPLKGLAGDVLSGLEEEARLRQSELDGVNSQLASLSAKYYTAIVQVEEQLAIEARQLEVANNFGFSDTAFAVEGWVPARRLHGIRDAVAGASKSAKVFEIEDEGSDPHSGPPTLLETPKKLMFFESFIRFYSIPLSNEVDPSIIFALAFPLFFGFMIGDVGYAAAILLISVWIIRRVNHPERKTLMPAPLRSFGGSILKPVQYRKLAKAMLVGSVFGMVMGFATNAYFGFGVNQYLFGYLNSSFHLGLPSDGTFLNPLSALGLKTLLLYSGYVGLFMVSFGLVLGMLNAYWVRNVKHILGKFGWLCAALGIAFTGLDLLHHESLSVLANPVSNPLIILIIVGMALVIYGEGGQAIIELPSIVSNIISYTRLLGILLAAFVLAFLIDNQVVGPTSSGTPGLLYGGVAFAILGVVLLVVVHLFNIVLSILEPGIQGARLIYVEHFSKYLHGGGRPFSPFRGPRVYTLAKVHAEQ